MGDSTVKDDESRLRRLHPTPEDTPTCMTVFDDFLACNVLANQLRTLYRFGETARCSAKWNEFKFCMSIKGLHPEQRRDVWIRHRAEWWARRRLGLSSENVWEMRTEPLRDYPPLVPPQGPIEGLVD
ncbi:hypothetical protein BC826DRAFT_1089647 [Russula brevipes]|nr:hypothetical protein BC826DRAFT_1089647 [Russula brevipes]